MISSNLKFNEFLKQIEEAKEKQRMLYEQSIVRLLKNIEKNKDSRDSESGMGSELRHRSQTGSIQSGKQNEKGKSWVSFGYRGQI